MIVVSSISDRENNATYKYNLNCADILKVLFAMKTRKVQKCWFANMCPKTVIVINCIFDAELCKEIWILIRKFYDQEKPLPPGKVLDIKSDLLPKIDNYMLRNCSVVAEFHSYTSKLKYLQNFLHTMYLLIHEGHFKIHLPVHHFRNYVLP